MPPPDIQIHVKGLSLGAELKDKDGRSSLRLSYEFAASPADDDDDDDDDENEDGREAPTITKEVILGSLTPGKVSPYLPVFGRWRDLLLFPLDRASRRGPNSG